MKFDNNTIAVLKNFVKINPSVVLDQGNVIKTISTNKTIMAKATVPVEFPQKMPLYELNMLLTAISLQNDPEVTVENGNRVVVTDGREETKFLLSDETTIIKPPEKDIVLPTVDVSFTLKAVDMASIEKAAGSFSLPEIHVSGNGENLFLKAADFKDPSKYTAINIGVTDKKFNAIFKFENLKIIPGDYEVSICSRGISKFVGKDIEYLIAVESNSTF